MVWIIHYLPHLCKRILECWESSEEEYDVTRNLRVKIGANEHGSMSLDLYEKADGPHMLVAGTTGSGNPKLLSPI